MDRQELHLEEYRILLETISHIFTEFWWGNAFFVSFFSLLTTGFVTNLDTLRDLPVSITVGLGLSLTLVATVWTLTNVKHDYYLRIHMNHATDLERDYLGCSIFSRRMVPAKGVARLSVRTLWTLTPGLFLLMELVILITAKLTGGGNEAMTPDRGHCFVGLFLG